MKVLLVGDYPPPHGGVAIHVQQLHRAFNAAGVTARVLDIGKGQRAKAPEVVAARGAPEVAAQLLRHGSDGWICHLHTSGNNINSFIAASAVGLTPRGPRVITLHSGQLPQFLGASVGNRVIARLALSSYGKIVAVSEAVRDAVLSIGVPPWRVEMHPAFCASQVVAPNATPRLEHVLRRRSPLIAYAHHPSLVYGRAVLFAALSELRARHPYAGLAVFGPGTRDAQFLGDARAAGVESMIEDLGELPHDEALALIARASAFVRPTLADGDAVTVREALLLGTPTVASDVCARPKGAILFRGGDSHELAERLSEAICGPRRSLEQPDAAPFLLTVYRSLLRPIPGTSYQRAEGRA